ncbi:MAG: sodium:calcium antiporter [Nitriliruptor sp.]|nr:MAG: sodium:calcium antiporter [Nitriliruptor sp.]
MLLAIAGVLLGLLLLTYAADQFVVGAARVAAALRISTIVIGAVVIGFGTSAPELVVSGLAAGRGQVDLAVGNIIGSNIANLTLVLGVAAMVAPIVVRSSTLKREAPLSLAAVVAFALLIQGGLSVLDGAILAIVLVGALTVIIVAARGGDPVLANEVSEYLTEAKPPLRRELTRTVLALIAVIVAAQVLVVSATDIARTLGLAEGFVGVTIVAIGTSLPELATAVQAARRRETDLIIGNLLGSNLFNAGAVGSVVAFAGPSVALDPSLAGLAALLMVGIGVIAMIFMISGARVARSEGIVLLVGYLVALPFLGR